MKDEKVPKQVSAYSPPWLDEPTPRWCAARKRLRPAL